MKDSSGSIVCMIDMSTTEFDLRMSRGHVLFDSGAGLLLVDTGSPWSFHESGRIRLCGEEFPVPTSLPGADSAYVSENVGEPVSGLVGMDIIGRLGLKIDVPGGRLTFSPSTEGMTPIPSGTSFGYVYMEMSLAGRPVRALFDTGAPTSYVSPSFTEGLAPVDRVTDFNPMVSGNTFETPIFELPAAFAGQAFTLRAGHLPDGIQMMVSVLGAKAVVGLEILSRFPVAVVGGRVWV